MNDIKAYSELLTNARHLLDQIQSSARETTQQGRAIDAHQVMTRTVARLSTQLQAAEALLNYALVYEGDAMEFIHRVAAIYTCEAVRAVFMDAELHRDVFDLSENDLSPYFNDKVTKECIRATLAQEHYCELGQHVLENPQNNRSITTGEDHGETELRESTRKFAASVIAPHAEEIHRNDLLVPEEFIVQMSALGYFGMSVPEEYGGVGMTNQMMVIATEELSAASLATAGSLITRPEILTKALLKGGTETQKATWLPRIAAGDVMVAVAVTEPNIGSDVASVACRASATTLDGKEGYLLNGAKAWCTFAGRADILALLARSESTSGQKGLSLFIVEKDRFDGHEFDMRQPSGGRLSGNADATLGYRGMHSFTLQFEDYFVPAENLVGEEEGRGRGFYLQMDGFAAGRLQTGGRAVGLAQACLETAVAYTQGRPQFGKPIAEFQNTQYELGHMAVRIEAARQLAYAAARAMDEGAKDATLLAAMAKYFACRVAVDVSQKGQLLHGGWGYAEEYPISRYVADALVLPIFEGVEPVLEMKVIGRTLLSAPS